MSNYQVGGDAENSNQAKSEGIYVETTESSEPPLLLEEGHSWQTRFVISALVAFLLFVGLNVYSQWQLKQVLETAKVAQDRLELYSTTFQMSKPRPNSNGIDVYNGYFAESAWNEFISKRLKPLAAGTTNEFTVLIFQLERQNVLGIFSQTSEAKRQLVEYFNLINEYLIATSNCIDSNCYTKAVEKLNGSDGKWGIVTLTLNEAKPWLDFFQLEERVDDILS